MMTSAEYRNMFTVDRDAARKTVRAWREAVATLDDIQSNDLVMNETPVHTVKCFVAEVGEEIARFVIASLVNRSAWDGRIYPSVSKWAEGVEGSLSEEAAIDAMISTRMHMAHLNQVAESMMKYQPDPEEEAEDATEVETSGPSAEEIVATVTEKVEQTTTRSAWDCGVKKYAEELLEELAEGVRGGWIGADDLTNRHLFERALLNGASDWRQFSEGGCALCYDGQIAERLCTPSELKRTDHGRKNPNPRENWIDCQSRALFQAANLILSAAF